MRYSREGGCASLLSRGQFQLLEAAIRVLVRSGESVKYSNGVYVVNGVSESPDDVIAYADDLYQVDKSIPLHDRAYVSGRPRKRVEK